MLVRRHITRWFNMESDMDALSFSFALRSHAWNCKFKDLLMLIESHYSRIVEATGGVAYVPVFYWIDIVAVTQVGWGVRLPPRAGHPGRGWSERRGPCGGARRPCALLLMALASDDGMHACMPPMCGWPPMRTIIARRLRNRFIDRA